MKAKLGHMVEVANTSRKFGSNNVYYAVHIFKNGRKEVILLTHEEYRLAANRANVNTEDLPKLRLSWFQQLLNLIK